jgi:elongation factor Ts
VETAGDKDKAIRILRERGLAIAGKKADRAAKEGRVAAGIYDNGKAGVMIEVNCETDFVAKNADFLSFAGELAELVGTRDPANLESLAALALGATTVEETRKALVGRISENMSIRRFARIDAKGRIARYVHVGAKIGVLLDYTGGDEQLGKDLAMHIAASKPIGLTAGDIPQALVKKERDIAAAKAAESGKPANIADKMVEGSVQKYLKEVALLGQAFVKDHTGKQTIEAVLKSKGASVSRFVLYMVGEGIERKTGDFAAEVMAQVGKAG